VINSHGFIWDGCSRSFLISGTTRNMALHLISRWGTSKGNCSCRCRTADEEILAPVLPLHQWALPYIFCVAIRQGDPQLHFCADQRWQIVIAIGFFVTAFRSVGGPAAAGMLWRVSRIFSWCVDCRNSLTGSLLSPFLYQVGHIHISFLEYCMLRCLG